MTNELPLAFSFPPGAQGPRDALANAPLEAEPLSSDEEELARDAHEDIAQGLTYSHEHVKRLTVPDWRTTARGQSGALPIMRVEWTRTGDMSHLGDPSSERRIHDALESFACSGYGNLYVLSSRDEYRLHVGDSRVRFCVQGRKVTILSVVRRERPSRISLRR
jgi:hypothetical protein